MGNAIVLNKIVPAKTHRFGITRQISSSDPAGTRINDAVGMTATPSIGSTAGHSDFDNYYPGKGMVRETLSTGDVMVKIPRFYYRRIQENDGETIEIADNGIEGFDIHPAFKHNNNDQKYIYVGAYETSGSQNAQTSLSGKTPLTNITRANFRTGAQLKGTGGGLLDIATINAIQMLYLTEFANNDAQVCIGPGSNSAYISTGGADSVANLTGRASGTADAVAVVYRGIENLGGNYWSFLDGINFNGGSYYICTNQADYADDTSTGYTLLSYTGSTGNTDYPIIKQMGVDIGMPGAMLPSVVSNETATTIERYYTDAVWATTGGGHINLHGGCKGLGLRMGLFMYSMTDASSKKGNGESSRLLYVPQ